MVKKMIFFDGDGTLWHPKSSKYKKPHHVYHTPGTHKDHTAKMKITPTTYSTLKKLKREGIITVILSAHPQKLQEAKIVINHKMEHFNLSDLFNEAHATRGDTTSKPKYIKRLLKKYKIPKSQALMVGDTYEWDIKPVNRIGVDTLLIETSYNKNNHVVKRIKRKITKIEDVLNFIS